MAAETVVVTGATGHLGNTLVRHLCEQGYAVRALVRGGDGGEAALEGLPITRATGDVTVPDSLVAAFTGADLVFHVAGLVSISTGQEDALTRVNVEGTRNVVEACLRTGVRRLVYTSSVHALTEPAGGTLDETAGFDPARAYGPYGKSKAAASRHVQDVGRSGGPLQTVLVLPTGCLGPWDFRFSEVGNVIANVGARRMPIIIGGGYEWVDVRDVAAGTLLAAQKGVSGEAYLLNASRLATEELCGLAARAAGVPPPMVCLPLWLARIVAAFGPPWEKLTGRRALLTPYAVHTLAAPFAVSSQKARTALGFTTRPLPESIADAWRWLSTHTHSPMQQRRRIGPGRSVLG